MVAQRMSIGHRKDVKRMSGNYLGESKHNLENNCRLIIPQRFRASLQPEFILFKAPEGCLFMYDTESFDEISKQLMELSGTKEGRARARKAMKAAPKKLPSHIPKALASAGRRFRNGRTEHPTPPPPICLPLQSCLTFRLPNC